MFVQEFNTFTEVNSDELKSLRDSVNWGIEIQREHFRYRLASLVSDNMPSRGLDLKEIFPAEEIDWLLANSINDWPGQKIIEFVAKAGYKDEPEVEEIDFNGQPSPWRTTLVHLVAKSTDLCGSEISRDAIISDLLKIYGKFHVNYIDGEAGLTHFHIACAFGRFKDDTVLRYLEHGQVDPNFCILLETGDTPLHLALNREGDFPNRFYVLQCLLRCGANPNEMNLKNGYTPLHVICQKSWTECDMVNIFFNMSKEFSDRQVNIDARDFFGRTALYLAVSNGLCHEAKSLLKLGADPNLVDSIGLTPLHSICMTQWLFEFNQVYMLKKFFLINEELKLKVEIDSRDELGNTPLHLAAYYGNDKIVESLLKLEAKPNLANDQGLTVLHMICLVGRDDGSLIDLCFEINQGFNKQLNVRDKEDRTPLQLALSRGYQNLVESLIRHGSDPNLANGQGLTPLHVICKRDVEEYDYLLERFYRICDELNHVVQVDARDKMGKTPLYYALAGRCKENIVRELLDRRANSHAVDKEGSTALHVICRRKDDDDLTEIFFEILEDLQQAVQVDAKDKTGRTPLEWAVANFLSKSVEELLRRGADLSGFVFPSEIHYAKTFPSPKITTNDSKLKLACRVFVCLNWMTKKDYKLTSSDYLTIAKFFAKYELFLDPKDLPGDEEFASRAKNTSSNKDNSIESMSELIASKPFEVAKLITIQDSLDFPPSPIDLCEMQLCEMISRRFILDLALYPFWELIHFRLPLEICNIILDRLMNKDLLSIILAAASLGTVQTLHLKTVHIE